MANLIDRLPDILKDFYEYQELAKAQDPEFELIDDLLLKWRENLFPKTADEDGIKFFEDLLKITPLPGDTLDVRRYRVLVKLNTRLPYTEIQLRRMLAAICGWDGFTLTVADLTLLLSLTEQSGAKIRVIYEMLREVVPMNILIKIHQLLNSYGVLYSAAATEMGITLVLLPWQNKELETTARLYSAAVIREGSTLTLLPVQEKEIQNGSGVYSAAAFRLGTALTLFPVSGRSIDEYITIAAPGVIRMGTRLEIGA